MFLKESELSHFENGSVSLNFSKVSRGLKNRPLGHRIWTMRFPIVNKKLKLIKIMFRLELELKFKNMF